MTSPLFPTPWMYGRRRLTRVEIAVYAVIIGALAMIFFSYLRDYMEMAEKTAMETTVSNVTAAINIRYATVVLTRGKPATTGQWTSGNPFELAHAFPPNYRGTLDGQHSREVERPAWVFDAARSEIVYLPRFYNHLGAGGDIDEVRFRLQRHPSGFGFVLAPTTPYQWTLSGFAENSQSPCRKICTPLFS